MEAYLLAKFENAVNQNINGVPALSPLAQTLALSLITNPSTSTHTLSSLLKTLTLTLSSLNPKSFNHHHILALLSALAHHHLGLRHQVCSIIRSHYLLPSTPTRILIEALSILFSIVDVASGVPDDSLFLSLCFRPCNASLRKWLLQNESKFSLRPSMVLPVLLGFTKDPYPFTRKAALDSLVLLCGCVVIEDPSLVEGCYFRAVALLFDAEESVRCSAVRAVIEWGNLLVVANQEECRRDWSDAIFLQICTMVRDMSMEVRFEAFMALGRVGMVSEDILLQTLAKKTTLASKDKSYPGQYAEKFFKIPASAAAFTFVHGLEDEYFKVRRSACHALRSLTKLSAEFTGEAVIYLMDVLNDDSTIVRLEVLETMHQIALSGHLKVQETQLSMLLGTLVDCNTLIRSAAIKILRLTKLHKASLFKLCINGLIRSLELYPQDEADLFSALFKIGRRHGKFVISIIQEAAEGIEPSLGGKFGFDDAKTAALLVLAISAPMSLEQCICTIPPRIYSYAVTMLGRISLGLADVVSQNTLLSFLSRCSRCELVSASIFYDREGQSLHDGKLSHQSQNGEERDEIFEGHVENILNPVGMFTPLSEDPVTLHDDLHNSASIMLQKIEDMWPLIQLGCIDEVTQTLRSWKEELNIFSCTSTKSLGALNFTLHYLDIVEELGQLWLGFMGTRKLSACGTGESGLLVGNLEKSLVEIRNRYNGLSKQEQLHILELMVVVCMLRLSNSEACSPKRLIKILNSSLSQMEQMQKEGSCDIPKCVIELKKQLHEIGVPMARVSENPSLFQKALECFSLRPFVLSGEITHKKATVLLNDDYLNPVAFVPNLPLGIPLEILLYNVSNKDRLWLRMRVEDQLTQFVFLDLEVCGDCLELGRKYKFVAPYYMTPRVKVFSIKVCVLAESLYEDCYVDKYILGPKYEVVRLCEEIEIHASNVVK